MAEAGRVSNDSEAAMVRKKSKFFGVSGKLKTIGRALAAKHDVNIEFGAGNPATDGKTVFLPHLKPGVTNEEMDTFVGYLHHEIGHCNHSDMEDNGIERLVGKLQGKYSKNYNFDTIKYIANAVEDVRIEQLDMDESPGAIDYFKTMKRVTSDEIVKNYKTSDTIENAVTDVIMTKLCNHHDSATDKTEHELLDKMKLNPHFAPMQKQLDPIFNRVIKDRKSPDALRQCTQELMRRIAGYIEQKNDDQMSEEQVQDAMDKLGQHINSGNSSTANNQGNGKGIQSGSDLAKDQFMRDNTTQNGREEENFGINPGMGSSDRLCRTAIDQEDKVKSIKESGKVRKAIVEAMMSHKNKLTKRYQDEGIFDVKKAHRFLIQGKTNVFKNIKKFKQINTVVDLCIDVSGSMGGWGGRGCMYQARKIAYAMDAAVKGTKIRMGMSVFDSTYYRLKAFNERLTDDHIELISANGGTNLSKAIYTSSKYISAFPEERKIVIAITDGGVYSDVKEVDQLIRESGIELYYIVVDNTEESARQMLKNTPIDPQYCAAFGGDFSVSFMKMFKNLILKGNIKHEKIT